MPARTDDEQSVVFFIKHGHGPPSAQLSVATGKQRKRFPTEADRKVFRSAGCASEQTASGVPSTVSP